MNPPIASRWLAATGILFASIGLIAAPAVAQPAITYKIELPDQVVTTTPGKLFPLEWPRISASAFTVIEEPQTVILDLSGLQGFASAHLAYTQPPLCTMTGLLVTCKVSQQIVSQDPFPIFIGVAGMPVIDPKPDAPAGAQGQIKVTWKIADTVVATDVSTVTVAEAVDLSDASAEKFEGPPGSTLPAVVGVRNTSTRPAHGVFAWFQVESFFLIPTVKHSNCSYFESIALWCRFDQDLAPGRTYAASLGFKFRDDLPAPNSINIAPIRVQWFTAKDWEVNPALHVGTPGTGPAATLTEASHAVNSLVPQSDDNPGNNRGEIALSTTGNHPADIAVVGATASGHQGETVTIKLGLENKGVATFYREFGPTFRFDVPLGTTVTEYPSTCHKTTNSDGTSSSVFCDIRKDFGPGERTLLPFKVRLDSAAFVYTGHVRALPAGYQSTDISQENNTATVRIVRVTEPDSQPATGSDGLPVTGTPVALFAAAGGVLLGLGFVLFRLTRRRKLADETE